jgi:hypothetical protein
MRSIRGEGSTVPKVAPQINCVQAAGCETEGTHYVRKSQGPDRRVRMRAGQCNSVQHAQEALHTLLRIAAIAAAPPSGAACFT